MKRTYSLIILILLTFSLFYLPQSLFADHSLEAGLRQAELYGKEGKLDFAFLELRDLLRRYPGDPHVPEIEFAVAEYLFLQNSFSEAKETFQRCLPKIRSDSTPRLLGRIYLLICLEKTGSRVASKELRAQLKKELSSQGLFLAFDDKRTRTWQSFLGTFYTLHEFVDRLEVLRNGKSLYALTLP